MKFVKFLRYIFTLIPLLGFQACDSDVTTYNFIGDSIVTRWDLQASFPVLVTRNFGLSGSGVKYLEDKHGRFDGAIVTVLSGTNDYRSVTSSIEAEKYALRYVDAIVGLGASRTYVLSILPRAFSDDNEHTLPTISMINQAISREIRLRENPSIVYLDVYDDFLDKNGHFNMNLSYDGLHLNPEGYEILTSTLNRYI